MMCWVLIYDYEQESETVFKNKETEKEKMLKLAKGLLFSVMKKFMAEILIHLSGLANRQMEWYALLLVIISL